MKSKIIKLIILILAILLLVGSIFYFFFWNPIKLEKVTCGTKSYLKTNEPDNYVFYYDSDVNFKFEILKESVLPYYLTTPTKQLLINTTNVDLEELSKTGINQDSLEYNKILKTFVTYITLNKTIIEEDKSNFKICFPNASFTEIR